MRRVVLSLVTAALAANSLATLPAARADWILGSAAYPLPLPTAALGSTYTDSSARPDISCNSQVFCSGSVQITSFSWSPTAIQRFIWSGPGTPTSSFHTDVVVYANGSATGQWVATTASSSASYGSTSTSGSTGNANSYSSQSPSSGAYAYLNNTGNVSPVDNSCSLSVQTYAERTNGCNYNLNGSGSGTAKAYVTFSAPY